MEVRTFGAALVALEVSYCLLVGQLSAHEAGLAAAGGALAALWAAALSRAGIRFRFDWQAIVTFAIALANVPRAALRVTVLLLRAGRRRPRGSIIDQPLYHGRDERTADATRRAAVLLATSLAPDKFALLHEGDRLYLHRLRAGPLAEDRQWPV